MKKEKITAPKDAFDILKFLLSFMVVAIHTHPFHEKIFPFVRIAVPMFFIISSYLLFVKAEEGDMGANVIKNYVKRNLKLYLFWFVVLLPITLFKQQYFFKGEIFLKEVLRFFRDLFLGETWITSWYIMASAIGAVLVYAGSRYIGNWFMVLVSVVLYAISCMASSYFFVIESCGIGKIYLNIEACLGKPYNNFVIAIVWITIGKLLAEKQWKINRKYLNFKVLTGFFVIFLLLLAGEHFLIESYAGVVYHTDVYIMLLPVSIVLFLLVSQSSVQVGNAKYLRRMSTIIYCSHWAIKAVFNVVFEFFHIADKQNILLFSLTAVCACIGSVIILLLAKKWKIFEYAY